MTTAEVEMLREEGHSEEEIAAMLAPKPWDRPRVIEAIREWAARHGRPPSGEDWRLKGEGRPTYGQVAELFGTWSQAIVDAGFPPPRNARLAKDPPRVSEGGDRVHSKPLLGPAPRVRRDFADRHGRPLPRPGDREPHDLAGLLNELGGVASEDEDVGFGVGKNGRPAPDTRHLVMSRGAKLRRLAEAMARLAGHSWAELGQGRRAGYLQLSDLVLDALELVEDDEDLLMRIRRGEKIDRESR